MSKTYTVSAKTVAEAMEKAKSLYGGGDSEITTEIIETPKKGFLGIGSKEAVIKITVEDNDSDDLASLVDDIKKYKDKTEKNTGYYVADSNKKSEEKKPKNNQKPSNSSEKNNKEKNNSQAPKKNAQQEVKDSEPKKEQKKPLPDIKPEKNESERKDKPEEEIREVKVSDKNSFPTDSDDANAEKQTSELRNGISEEEMNFSVDFINSIIRDMDLYAIAERAEVPEGTEYNKTEGYEVYPVINVTGDDTGILIGHHGETLDSLQYLVNLALFRKFGENNNREGLKVIVDIENYRQKREDTLKILARKMASKAVKYRKNIFLEPMNPYERRIIHSELQNYPGVSTHSVGSDLNRKIVVTYEGNGRNQSAKKKKSGRDYEAGDAFSAESEE